jgi:D-alanine transaminase
MSRVAYVDRQYVPHRSTVVHTEDRGYQFADDVYEVVAVVGGRLVGEQPHFTRFTGSLPEVQIAAPLSDVALRIVTGNGVPGRVSRRLRQLYLAHAAAAA